MVFWIMHFVQYDVGTVWKRSGGDWGLNRLTKVEMYVMSLVMFSLLLYSSDLVQYSIDIKQWGLVALKAVCLLHQALPLASSLNCDRTLPLWCFFIEQKISMVSCYRCVSPQSLPGKFVKEGNLCGLSPVYRLHGCVMHAFYLGAFFWRQLF